MKTQIGLYLQVGTAEELRARAAATGSSVGDLADLCIRATLAKMADKQIRAWASKLPNLRGRTGGALRKNEREVMAALERLEKKDPGAYRFNTHDVAVAAGLRTGEAFLALTSLEARALTRSLVMGDGQVDRFGRPISCVWSRANR